MKNKMKKKTEKYDEGGFAAVKIRLLLLRIILATCIRVRSTMAGKRISASAIDWAKFAKCVSENEMRYFQTLKYRNDSYIRRVAANPDALPKIDWDYYKNNISTPGLVDNFKQKYESLTIPYPSDQGLISKINEGEKKMEAEYVEMEKDIQAKKEKMKEELIKCENQLSYSEMTVEEYFLAKPEVALYPLGPPTLFPHYEEQIEYTAELIEKGELKC